MARSWRAAVRPVVPLSGGVDSRYLAAMAVRVAGGPERVETITWGEEPTKPGSDGVIAPKVAAALGVPNLWCEKRQVHDVGAVERALYLTSAESDGALNYPSDDEFHERLVEDYGWRSLFRGDQIFGEDHYLLTQRALFPAAGLTLIGRDPIYAKLLGVDRLGPMSEMQHEVYTRWKASLTTGSAYGRLYELKYESAFRRELFPYNTLKDNHFEVYTPFLDRPVLDWIRELPSKYRSEKRLFRIALDRRFPSLAAIPFASRSNVTDFELRSRIDPNLAHSLYEMCDRPGWLDSLGAKRRVMDALAGLEAQARTSSARETGPAEYSGLPARQRLSGIARDGVRATLPGKLVREWTIERRAIANRTMYQRLSRLVVVHVLVGQVQARHLRRRRDSD